MSAVPTLDDLLAGLARVSGLEAPAEVRERLFLLTKVPQGLFRFDVEVVPGGAAQVRLALQLSDAGRHLATALGAGEVDFNVVEEALDHPDLSLAWQQGVDAESGPGETSVPAERDGAERPAPEREPLEGRVTREAEWLNPGLGRSREPGA